MNPTFKKACLVGLTLALIGGVSGALIGTVNYFTAPVIANNDRIAAENAALSAFSGSTKAELGEGSLSSWKSLTSYYIVSNDQGEMGYAFSGKTTASGFGEMNLIVGVNDGGLVKAIITANNQSKGTEFQTYIDQVNTGDRQLSDVKGLGATYSSDAAKSVIEDALDAYKSLKA